MPTVKATSGRTLLNPSDHTLILIDIQSQMAFATRPIDAIVLRNNDALISNAANTPAGTFRLRRLSARSSGWCRPARVQ
jgi:hypothetical protein